MIRVEKTYGGNRQVGNGRGVMRKSTVQSRQYPARTPHCNFFGSRTKFRLASSTGLSSRVVLSNQHWKSDRSYNILSLLGLIQKTTQEIKITIFSRLWGSSAELLFYFIPCQRNVSIVLNCYLVVVSKANMGYFLSFFEVF